MSCCPDLITLTDAARAKQYSTYVVLLQIQHHAEYIIGECQQLTLHRILQSMDSGNAVRYPDNGTDIRYFQPGGISLNLFFNNRTDFLRS